EGVVCLLSPIFQECQVIPSLLSFGTLCQGNASICVLSSPLLQSAQCFAVAKVSIRPSRLPPLNIFHNRTHRVVRSVVGPVHRSSTTRLTVTCRQFLCQRQQLGRINGHVLLP